MSKKKRKGQDGLTEENLENFLKMMEHLPEEAKERIRQMATGMAPESNDPDDLNIQEQADTWESEYDEDDENHIREFEDNNGLPF